MTGSRFGAVDLAGYGPGALGEVCAMQARYYAREWGFGRAFETKVAAEMAAFLERFDPAIDLFQVAVCDGRIVGSVTLDGGENGAGLGHLRWFCVDDGMRGRGVGSSLMESVESFAATTGLRSIYLTTFEGLEAARALYERHGYRLVHSSPGESWGTRVVEQRYEKSV